MKNTFKDFHEFVEERAGYPKGWNVKGIDARQQALLLELEEAVTEGENGDVEEFEKRQIAVMKKDAFGRGFYVAEVRRADRVADYKWEEIER